MPKCDYLRQRGDGSLPVHTTVADCVVIHPFFRTRYRGIFAINVSANTLFYDVVCLSKNSKKWKFMDASSGGLSLKDQSAPTSLILTKINK